MIVILLFALSCVFAEEDKVGDFEIPLGLDLHGIVYFACFVISLIIIAPIAMLIQAIVDCFCGSRSCCYPCICPGQSDECCLGNNDDYISKPWCSYGLYWIIAALIAFGTTVPVAFDEIEKFIDSKFPDIDPIPPPESSKEHEIKFPNAPTEGQIEIAKSAILKAYNEGRRLSEENANCEVHAQETSKSNVWLFVVACTEKTEVFSDELKKQIASAGVKVSTVSTTTALCADTKKSDMQTMFRKWKDTFDEFGVSEEDFKEYVECPRVIEPREDVAADLRDGNSDIRSAINAMNSFTTKIVIPDDFETFCGFTLGGLKLSDACRYSCCDCKDATCKK